MTTFAFVMKKTGEPLGRSLQSVLAGHMAYAGIAILLIGAIWAVLQVLTIREKKKRSAIPSMAMLLGACSFVVAMVLLYVLE